MKAQWMGIAAVAVVIIGCQSPGVNSRSFGNRGPDASNQQVASLSRRGAGRKGPAGASGGTAGASRPGANGPAAALSASSPNGSADVTELLKRGHAAFLQADRMERENRSADAQRLYAQARAYYYQALEKDPKNSLAHHRLAVIADKQGDFQTAESHYQAAINADPANVDLLNDLGYSYLLQGRYAESERYLQSALRRNPGHPQAINNLGLLYARRGEYDRALAMFRRTGTEAEARQKLAQLLPSGISLQQVLAHANPAGPPSQPSVASASPGMVAGADGLSGGTLAGPPSGPLSSPSSVGASTNPATSGPVTEQTLRLKAMMEQARRQAIAARERGEGNGAARSPLNLPDRGAMPGRGASDNSIAQWPSQRLDASPGLRASTPSPAGASAGGLLPNATASTTSGPAAPNVLPAYGATAQTSSATGRRQPRFGSQPSSVPRSLGGTGWPPGTTRENTVRSSLPAPIGGQQPAAAHDARSAQLAAATARALGSPSGLPAASSHQSFGQPVSPPHQTSQLGAQPSFPDPRFRAQPGGTQSSTLAAQPSSPSASFPGSAQPATATNPTAAASSASPSVASTNPLDSMPLWPSRQRAAGGGSVRTAQSEIRPSSWPVASNNTATQNLPGAGMSTSPAGPVGATNGAAISGSNADAARQAAFLGMQAGPGQLFPVVPSGSGTASNPATIAQPMGNAGGVVESAQRAPALAGARSPAQTSVPAPLSPPSTLPGTASRINGAQFAPPPSWPAGTSNLPGVSGLDAPRRSPTTRATSPPAPLPTQMSRPAAPRLQPADPLAEYEQQIQQQNQERLRIQQMLQSQRQALHTPPQWPHAPGSNSSTATR